jgi:cellulase
VDAEQWENEKLISQGNRDTVQLPSDIKSGRYILRTELVALHSNSMSIPGIGGPQFFTHCFNVDITGDGTATPAGVKFPGGYKRTDSGVKFNLYVNDAAWDNYVSVSGNSMATF